MIDKFNLEDKFSQFDELWSPKIIAELNGQAVKLAKLQGEFVWHHHEHEDELFMVIKGSLLLRFRDHNLTLREGELAVIPAGVEHQPFAAETVHVLLFEPISTLNTGNVHDEHTVTQPDKI